MKKGIFILAIVFVLLMASIAPAKEVIERYRMGNSIEDLTYISKGKFAGKLALRDGLNVYSYDLNSGKYKKLFCFARLNFGVNRAGIAFISTGDFSGNFLMTNINDFNKLFIVSISGDLVAIVTIDGFPESVYEGLTEITSGPYQGKFAMIGHYSENYVPHIVIFSIDQVGGDVKASLWKDIVSEDLYNDPLGICFLPDDFPDPQYQNHFLISQWTYEFSPEGAYTITVIDDNGQKKISYPVDYWYEGLAYINKGKYKGNVAVCDYTAKDTWIRKLDGTDKTLYNVKLGLGLSEPSTISWSADTNQLLLIGSDRNFYFLSRLGPETWKKDREVIFSTPGMHYEDISELTPDGYYSLEHYTRENIHTLRNLDSDFTPKFEYPLPQYFYVICYIPGTTQADDRFALVARGEEKIIYLFNNIFSSSEMIDLSGKVDRIADIYYDASTQRYYLLDSSPFGSLIRVFNSSWESIVECNVSNLVEYNYFERLTKMTSGDLEGNFILYSNSNSEIVIVDLEKQVSISQMEKLIADVQNRSIDQGIKNSLAQKLENAKSSIEKGNINAAVNKMAAFQNEIQTQRGKKIPEELADCWIKVSQDIIQSLENL